MEKPTVPLSMRIEPDLKAKLKRLAERENRSLANFIETALRQLAAEACTHAERR